MIGFGIVLFILIALAFDVMNGFHDAANSIATVVSTKVLTPRQAVVWAAVFNMVAFLVFEPHVASNIAKGVQHQFVSLELLASALLGAISWNLLTWFLALPSSSSHALLGGLAGPALYLGGLSALDTSVYIKTALFVIISPLLGAFLGSICMYLLSRFFSNQEIEKREKKFRVIQLFTSALYSLGHGANDAQKTMGVILAGLYAKELLARPTSALLSPPMWVVISSHAAMALGTLFGGFRIVHTLGVKLTQLTSQGGSSAESSAAVSLFLASSLGVPVSTTHTITGAIVGVGLVDDRKRVSQEWIRKIAGGWLLTVPCSALCSLAVFLGFRFFGIRF